MLRNARYVVWTVLAALAGCATPPSTQRADLARIDHVIVLYAENRSFDNLYGLFPGANGLANATPAQYTQVDRDGTPLPHLPPVWKGSTAEADAAFPKDLPNRPYGIDQPPWLNPPVVSSAGPPGACTTPSRAMNSLTTIRMSDLRFHPTVEPHGH